MKILVAEDNPDYRAALQESLENYGHTVLAASNGSEAFELLQQFPAELIISDIDMPDCTGTQLHEMVRSHEKLRCLPFVYLTGFAILRLATPLDDTILDFMVNKVPFERLLRVVKDLSGQSGDNSSGTPAIGTA